ncbi:MAG: YbaB/EbfC family nucleoid-associated protein [Candidatus Gracilibacteria bacterium]|nr:YbaB/EbfC family nucleoid-associated protein [Candidatus Gracilibacteria bacterium]
MDMSKMGEMMKLQQEAMKIQKELENTVIEAEVNGLVISINGKMDVEKVDFETLDLIPGLNDSQKVALQEAIKNAYNKGSKKAQEVASSKMQGVMSQMGLNMPAGGLPGM